MKIKGWNVVWKVADHSWDLNNDDPGKTLGVYIDPYKAAKIAIEHGNTPYVEVQMQLYKDEWMKNVIK